MKKGYRQLIEEAEAETVTLPVEEAITAFGEADTVFVDLRDIRELSRQGRMPGAVHASRGMLEFWVDPDSPYHRPVFSEPKRFIFFCAAGWRSALATKAVQDMGLENVAHIAGGFGAWQEASGAAELPDPKW
ncbi:rhodanese-like domain-containing protein [Breoghania sp.]|uniref:rhodanese-like domain-containing protein n=1 Tax=Breoghania sp. TaxID=2065378 RepID=UPI002615795B|nr:rhodanese-like domain-containing protein [Breoghania sp.]MDJ0929906.1 rhodanese-like domain-containing protein [Breoghania sp.]